MRKSILLTATLAIIVLLGGGIYSCQKDGVQWPGSPDYDAGPIPSGEFVDRFALALTDDPAYKLVVLNANGESLVATTTTDAGGAIVDIAGGILTGADGASMVVRFDEGGWPKHAVYNGYVFLFTNWTAHGVDMIVVDPDGMAALYQQTLRGGQAVKPLGKPYHPDRPLREYEPSGDLNTIQELPAPAARTPYMLSQFGRSMQAYGYSLPPYSIPARSIMPNRPYSGDGTAKSWAQWLIVGVSIVAEGFPDIPDPAFPASLADAEIVTDGEAAIMNPYLGASNVKVAGDHCLVTELSDIEVMYCDAYADGMAAFAAGRNAYGYAMAFNKDYILAAFGTTAMFEY